MKNTQNKSGFTLVELIIVITILAVLATIAFLSFQGYASQSRDARVQSEIGNIRNSMEVKVTEWVSVLSLVASTGSNLASITLGGTGADITNANYKAGNINFSLLGADSNKYKDAYKVGGSTKLGGVYQIAGKLEKNLDAYVVGNYSPRTATGIAYTDGDVTAKTLVIADPSTGSFKVGDVTTAGKVTKISADLRTITVDGTVATSWTITLGADESKGLIKETGTGTDPVTNGSTADLPY